MCDDMGYSDIGCYGGEIQTPNLDRLARDGVRLTQFYNTARCCPTRASLLTGLHPHQAGVGMMTTDDHPEGYAGNLNRTSVTIAEVLKADGYRTYMSGKWHVCNKDDNWPIHRGFDEHYGIITGASNYFQPSTLKRNDKNIEDEAREDPNYYFTDAISENAAEFINMHASKDDSDPMFMYVAYTAPHWPLHAPEEAIAKYKGRFDDGWDRLREQRIQRMVEMGLIEPYWALSDRDSRIEPWEEREEKAWEARRMEVYAAQVDVMDQGIGRILDTLEENDMLDNTLIMFLSDNGGCAEELDGWHGILKGAHRIGTERTKDGRDVVLGNYLEPRLMPGGEETYQSYGRPWANLSNTPFRLYKHWIHEGGIATPFIMHWPDVIKETGVLRNSYGQLTDVMATILDATGASYPQEYNGNTITPKEGCSLLPVALADRSDRTTPLCWEHHGNSGMRKGKWKLVKEDGQAWELFDMEQDRTELNDLAGEQADLVAELELEYQAWEQRCGVIPVEILRPRLKMKKENMLSQRNP